MISFLDISDEEFKNDSQNIEKKIYRFLIPLNEEKVDQLLKGRSQKTEEKGRWTMSLFEIWQQNRKKT